MPVFYVSLREGANQEQKQQLIERLCVDTHELLSIPLDKIAVVIQDVPLANWGQAGVAATNPQYAELSRRLTK